MEKFIVHGGSPLSGHVNISGSKNASLPILAATLLTREPCVIRRVPDVSDTNYMLQILQNLGAEVERASGTVVIKCEKLRGHEAPYDLVRKMRASVCVMGPLLARYGRARVSLPGGCAIGARPIDQHLRGFEALGAKVVLERGYVELTAERLKGATFVFDLVTVGGTQNVMMAATLAKGTSRLENVAREPEVEELARILNKMGARIRGAGTSVIEIEGVDSLQGVDHAILPDRIEAGTFMVGAAITGGDVTLRHAPVDDLHAVIAKMEEAGVLFDVTPEGLRVRGPDELRPIDVTTSMPPAN